MTIPKTVETGSAAHVLGCENIESEVGIDVNQSL